MRFEGRWATPPASLLGLEILSLTAALAALWVTTPSVAAPAHRPTASSVGLARFPTARTAVAIRAWLTLHADLPSGDIALLTAKSALAAAVAPSSPHEATGVWFRQEIFDGPLAKAAGGRSVLLQLKLDCAAGSALVIDVLVYPGNGLTGGPPTSPPAAQWATLDPDAPVADLALVGCGAPTPSPPPPSPPSPARPQVSDPGGPVSQPASPAPAPMADPDIEMLPSDPNDEGPNPAGRLPEMVTPPP